MAKSKDFVRLARIPIPEIRHRGPAVRLPGKSLGPAIQLPRKATAGLSDAEIRDLADALVPILQSRSGAAPASTSIDVPPSWKLRRHSEQTATERALIDAERKATAAYLNDKE